MKRRDFLRRLAATAGLVPLSSSLAGAWAAPGTGNGRALVVVFLRGGCDGLNMVVPHGDDQYYRSRPRIAIAPPGTGTDSAALDIDGYFGLHPALAPLQSIYDEGRLALLPAVHSPEHSRSHFHAQSVVERAGGSAGDGWLNRYLREGGMSRQALAISSQVPESLQGGASVPAYAEPLDRVLSLSDPLDDMLGGVLRRRYVAETEAASAARSAWRLAARDLEASRASIGGAASLVPYPDGSFSRDLAAAAALLRESQDLSIVMLGMGGWDTHSKQGGAEGVQSRQFAELASGLAAFEQDLGPRRDEVAVLVQTEFGRTLRENASGGTDHGGASAWMILSSSMRGGIHLGTGGWPGLDEGNLLDGRALAPAVDFRDVYADLLARHLGCTDISQVLPGRPGGSTGLV